MNILHLKYAVEVANTGSINKAAENLYMNQPNLSRAIKELEDSLCITIFDRTTRGMVVTPDGEEFLRYARKILRQIDEVEAIYSKEKRDQQRFSISVPRACYISDAFAQFVRRLDKEKPAEVFYQETNTMSAINNILHADYQLAIIRYASDCGKYFKRMLEEKGL
ncbi:MAG: LysR family transcriptional regulator, partial [Clostridia bacterium]